MRKKLFWTNKKNCVLFQLFKQRKVRGKKSWNKLVKTSDDTMAISLPLCENEMVRTGHSKYESLRRVAFWRVLLARNLRRKTVCTPHRKSIWRYFFFVKSQCELTDAMAMSLPSCENEMVRTGHSRYEKVLTQANSLTSHNETSASALPTAKYLPVGSNSIQMQFAGCACNTKNRKKYLY